LVLPGSNRCGRIDVGQRVRLQRLDPIAVRSSDGSGIARATPVWPSVIVLMTAAIELRQNWFHTS
jgi:hypothetical protein